jgi:hypothetical protein
VLARQLRGLSAAAEDWNAVAGKLKPAQHECANTFGLLVDLCAQVSAAQSLSVQQLTNQAEAMRASPPSWVSPRRMEAVVALCRLSSMWLAHRLTGAALAIAVGLFWVIQAGASVIEYGARLVAWPAIAIFEALRSRRQEPAAMGAIS